MLHCPLSELCHLGSSRNVESDCFPTVSLTEYITEFLDFCQHGKWEWLLTYHFICIFKSMGKVECLLTKDHFYVNCLFMSLLMYLLADWSFSSQFLRVYILRKLIIFVFFLVWICFLLMSLFWTINALFILMCFSGDIQLNYVINSSWFK